jgi:hypothetical protein
LGARDDLADPVAEDAVLRQSSKVQGVVAISTQATYDLLRWSEFLGEGNQQWMRDEDESALFYHFGQRTDLLTPAGEAVRRECDMLAWLDAGDAPVYVSNSQPEGPVKDRGHFLHHPAHARAIAERCAAVGLRCDWVQKGGGKDPVAFVLGVVNGG